MPAPNASAPPTACALCGSKDIAARERRGRFIYGQCARCSLAFVLNPLSQEQALGQYSQGLSSKLAYYRMAAGADARSFNLLLRQIERYVPRGRILDVGCNIGTFVRTAGSRGWSATGVDVNADAVQLGRSDFGLDLLTAEEFEARGDADFDVVHSSDTVEHFTDPSHAVRYYASKVKPGGYLFISTPNYESLLCKIFQLKATEHLFLFNERSFRYFFDQLGLEWVQALPFDRYRNIAAMFESTTFDALPAVQSVFKAIHRIVPELPLRLPGGENILAIVRTSSIIPS